MNTLIDSSIYLLQLGVRKEVAVGSLNWDKIKKVDWTDIREIEKELSIHELGW